MTTAPSNAFAATLVAITLIGPLSVHLFLPAIPVVKADLGLSEAMAQLTFTIALISMAISTLVYGSLADRFGRRPVLLAGLVLFLIGSAMSALAPDIWLLIAGRIVQAAGAGCGVTLVRAIARDTYGQDQLVKAIAYITMFYTLGPTLAPMIGGLLIDHYGWRTLFAFAIVAGALILWVAWLMIPETRPATPSDVPRQRVLMVYRDLFSRIRFNAFVLHTGLSTGTFFITATAAAFIMRETLNRPAAEFGLYFAPFPLGFTVGTFISARLGNRIRIETMVLTGSIILVVSVATQAAVLLAGYVTPLTLCLPGFFITLAQGIALPSSQSGAIATAPLHAGTAAGVGVCVQMLVGGLAAQVYGLFADGTIAPFLISAALCATATMIAGIVAWSLAPPGHRRRS